MRATSVHSQPTPSWAKDIGAQQSQQTQKTEKKDNNRTTKNNQNKRKQQTTDKSESKSKSDENKEVDWKEQQQTQKLRQRDNEVRQHEAAHKTTGGKYAGNISYTYQQGPDGNRYAVGGEVGMDISPEAGDPEKTIEKAETVRKAALAPAQPSGQDLKIAAKAAKMKMQASAELKQEDSKLNKSNKLNSLDNLYKNSEQPNQSSAQISLVA
jgi:hypothetical protein